MQLFRTGSPVLYSGENSPCGLARQNVGNDIPSVNLIYETVWRSGSVWKVDNMRSHNYKMHLNEVVFSVHRCYFVPLYQSQCDIWLA